jgi:hypothetical protein
MSSNNVSSKPSSIPLHIPAAQKAYYIFRGSIGTDKDRNLSALMIKLFTARLYVINIHSRLFVFVKTITCRQQRCR